MLLSSRGRFYLVAVQQNKPLEIIAKMQELGLDGKVRENYYGHPAIWSDSVCFNAHRSY